MVALLRSHGTTFDYQGDNRSLAGPFPQTSMFIFVRNFPAWLSATALHTRFVRRRACLAVIKGPSLHQGGKNQPANLAPDGFGRRHDVVAVHPKDWSRSGGAALATAVFDQRGSPAISTHRRRTGRTLRNDPDCRFIPIGPPLGDDPLCAPRPLSCPVFCLVSCRAVRGCRAGARQRTCRCQCSCRAGGQPIAGPAAR